MNKIVPNPKDQGPGIRFVRLLNKELAVCAAVFAVSLGTASAQFTYTGNANIATNVTYDGLGVDSGLNPLTIGTSSDNDYIISGASLTVLSGSLTINDSDFKAGNSGSAGTLILGANATLNINNIGQWGGALGYYNNNTGTLIISNNATVNWQIAGTSEQRFAIGSGSATSAGTLTLYGGAMNLIYGAAGLSDSEAQFSIGGENGTGTVNLNAGILTDTLPLPCCLGCYYTAVLGSPTLGQSVTVDQINILNGTFAVTGIFEFDPIYPDRASFNVGTNSYVNFIPGGTGSLSLTNWDITNYTALVASNMIRVADCPTTTNTLAYSRVSGMGILKLGASLVVAASPLNPSIVFAGTSIPLHATLYGFTSPTINWQAGPDGVTWTNIPGATGVDFSVNTSFLGGSTVYYQLAATNTGGATATSATLIATINPATAPIISVQPQPVTNYVGETVHFSVTASGAGTLSYKWQRNSVDMTDGITIHGVHTSTLTLDSITAGQADSYDVVVANFVGPTPSTSATLTVVPAPSGNLVGHWLAGPSTFADVSGYTPPGTHDGFLAGNTNVWFTNDVPPTATGGNSLYFATNADTVLAITNSSTVDLSYTNTFDDALTNGFTVMFWAKGANGGAYSWNPWVSKNGDGGEGWQLRNGGAQASGGLPVPCWTVRGGAGTFVVGGGPAWSEGGDQEDLHAAISGSGAAGTLNYLGTDSNWHSYAGTVDLTLGIRSLYVDGTLYGQEIGCGQNIFASDAYVAIGAKDSGSASFGGFFTGNAYDVRLYNYPLVQSAVRNVAGFKPTLNITMNGANAMLNWSWGTLQGATSVVGPWTPVSTASPYTNSMTDPRHFFRVSNP